MDFELRTIPGCPHTVPGRDLFSQALALEGAGHATVSVKEVSTDDQAEALEFHGSPTFCAGGVDLFASNAAPAVTCRVYPTPAGLAGLPTLDSLRQAVRAAIKAS